MSKWRVIQNLTQGEAMIAEVRTRLTSTGAEKIAAEAAVAMEEASKASFGSKTDPRTGQAWVPAAESTKADKRAGTLLHRTGELEGDIVSGYTVTPGGARAFINVQFGSVRKAMINLYGVTAKHERSWVRSRTGKTEHTRRKNPAQAWPPARRFVGLPGSKIAEIINHAEQIITGGL
jgi:phage gpG-like protein